MATHRSPIILEVIAGSRLYGLARPDSDYDIRSVFMVSNATLLGILPYEDSYANEFANNEDRAGWELGKFAKLAAAGSFTALELLFAERDSYRTITTEGDALIRNRDLFLTEQVRRGLLGFVNGQLKAALRDGHFKPFLHAWRVLLTLEYLYKDGTLKFRLPDMPAVAAGTEQFWRSDPTAAVQSVLEWADRVAAFPAKFPDRADLDKVNALVLRLRS